MRVVLSTYWLTHHPHAGGHFWVYAQYADALRRLGCDVWWLEQISHKTDPADARAGATLLAERLKALGLGDRLIVYRWQDDDEAEGRPVYLDLPEHRAEQVLRDTDLLVNFHYALPAGMLARFRRTALVELAVGPAEQPADAVAQRLLLLVVLEVHRRVLTVPGWCGR